MNVWYVKITTDAMMTASTHSCTLCGLARCPPPGLVSGRSSPLRPRIVTRGELMFAQRAGQTIRGGSTLRIHVTLPQRGLDVVEVPAQHG